MSSMKSLATGAVMLGLTLGAAVSIAAAQQPGGQTGQPKSGMMGNRGGGMVGMMGVDRAQVNRMIENCNQLVGSMMQTSPNAPSPPATPGSEKQG